MKISEDTYLLTAITKACRLNNNRVSIRFPIQKDVLNLLLQEVNRYLAEQPYLRILYKALFASAYFGLFRVGELTSGSHPVLAKDVHIGTNKKKLLFVLHSSKTHTKGDKPQLIKIQAKEQSVNKCKELAAPKGLANI